MTLELYRYLTKEDHLELLKSDNDINCLNCGSPFFKNRKICNCYEKIEEPFNYIFSINRRRISEIDCLLEKIKINLKSKSAKINRLNLEREADGSYTDKDLNVIYIIQKGLCYYCRTPIGKIKNKYTIDHVVPLSDGGTHWPLNLALTCPSCNSRKSWTTESYYLKKIREGMSVDERKNHKEYVASIRKMKRKIFKKQS